MGTVTLIGTRLAEEDVEFVYNGESDACEGCPYRDQCLNLTVGRRYRVTSVRENASTLDCAVHDTGVTAVEVEPKSVTANVPDSEAFVGNKTTLAGPCPHTGCPSHEFCVPMGADFDVEYRITEVHGESPHDHCHLDRDLKQVEFEAPDE
jgi:uncharacterized protein (UPF0179 family)